MKNRYVADLKTNDEIISFFMLKSYAVRTGSNGKDYIDMTVGDKTGDIAAKKWDVQSGDLATLEPLKDGGLIKLKAVVTEWQNTKQLKVQRIRAAVPQDELDIQDYIKAAPEKPEDMYQYLLDTAAAMKDRDLSRLCCKVLEDHREKLMYYPAAAKNHHAIFAGLLYHTKRMLMTGLKVCEVYTDLDPDLVAAGVILHDIQKINEIESNEFGVSPGYSMEGQLLGHIVMGVKYLDRVTEELGFPREKQILIEHMVLTHHYEPEFGSPKRPMFPEAELLHYLDILDARLYDMFDALRSADPGKFSEKVWTLDNRKIYKIRGEREGGEE